MSQDYVHNFTYWTFRPRGQVGRWQGGEKQVNRINCWNLEVDADININIEVIPVSHLTVLYYFDGLVRSVASDRWKKKSWCYQLQRSKSLHAENTRQDPVPECLRPAGLGAIIEKIKKCISSETGPGIFSAKRNILNKSMSSRFVTLQCSHWPLFSADTIAYIRVLLSHSCWVQYIV